MTYYLPFQEGTRWQITQGPGGSVSHTDVYNRYAIDFGMSEGTPVLASAAGTVVFAGVDSTNAIQVRVRHSDGRCTQYTHLSRADVSSGDTVTGAERVGLSGSTGLADGPHLHWGLVNCDTQVSLKVIDTVEMGTRYPVGWSAYSQNGGEVAASGGGRLAMNSAGRKILVAIKKNGTMYTRTAAPGRAWGSFVKQGAEGSWASAAVTVSDADVYRLIAVKKTGTLYTRYARPGRGWSAWLKQGADKSWSTTEQPDIATSPTGRVIIAAVKKTGTLYTRTASSSGWSTFRKQGVDDSWASASVAIGAADTFRVMAVKKTGTLYTRYARPGRGWSAWLKQGADNSWSTTEQPSVATGGDILVGILMVKKNGSLYYRAGYSGSGWASFERQGVAGSWTS